MLEGLSYLMTFSPPLIHHDLKPANVCVSATGIKIIDFGAVVLGTPTAQREPAFATPLYQPSEAGSYRSFDFPVHSYDVYAVGLIYMQMLCPTLQDSDWYSQKTYLGQKTTLRQILRKRCPDLGQGPTDKDLDLIAQMLASNPRKRPSPTEALEHDALTPAPRPLPHVDDQGNWELLPAPAVVRREPEPPVQQGAAQFRKGDLIEYWSPSNKRWLDGVVSYVHPGGQYLNLDTDSGTRLKHWAKISQVKIRVLKLEFKAGDKVMYKHRTEGPHSRAHWIDAVVKEVLPTQYLVKYLMGTVWWDGFATPDEVKRMQPKVDAPSTRRAYPAADPRKPRQPGLINPEKHESVGVPQFEKLLDEYELSSLVTVLEPTFTQSKGVLLMEIKVVCDYSISPCQCDKIMLYCQKGKAREAEVVPYASRTHFGSLKFTKDDPLKGSTCSVIPYVTSGNGWRIQYRGYARPVTVPLNSYDPRLFH